MKLKKIFAASLACAMVLSLAACGGDSGGGTSGSGSSGGGETITLDIGYTTAINDDDPYHVTALGFKEVVE